MRIGTAPFLSPFFLRPAKYENRNSYDLFDIFYVFFLLVWININIRIIIVVRHWPRISKYFGTVLLGFVVVGAAFELWWVIVIPLDPLRNYQLLPLLVLMHVFAFLIVYSYAKASIGDPGFVPYGWVTISYNVTISIMIRRILFFIIYY